MPVARGGAAGWARAASSATASVAGAMTNRTAASLPSSWFSVVGDVRYVMTPSTNGPRTDESAMPRASSPRTRAISRSSLVLGPVWRCCVVVVVITMSCRLAGRGPFRSASLRGGTLRGRTHGGGLGADDRDRQGRGVHDCVADRAEQHAGERSVTAGSDDDEPGAGRGMEHGGGGRGLDERGVDLHVRVLRADPLHGRVESLLRGLPLGAQESVPVDQNLGVDTHPCALVAQHVPRADQDERRGGVPRGAGGVVEGRPGRG